MNDKTNENPENNGTMTKEEKREWKKYNVILQTRNFELSLFWQRSLFYWGFIASAFIGYATLGKDIDDVSGETYNALGHFMVTVFGFVCSYAWVLVNLGGKHWQENWENRLYEAETKTTEELFGSRHPEQQSELSFSPSKVTIFLSRATTVIWGILLLGFSVENKFCDPKDLYQFIENISWYKFFGIAVLLIAVREYMRCRLRSDPIKKKRDNADQS